MCVVAANITIDTENLCIVYACVRFSLVNCVNNETKLKHVYVNAIYIHWDWKLSNACVQYAHSSIEYTPKDSKTYRTLEKF